MASIHQEIIIDAHPNDVWNGLRDFGAVHQRLVPGFVVDLRLDGDDRIVTFFNGAVARERLVAVDDEQRRLVWSAIESPAGLTHHNASAQVFAAGAGQTRFVWVADILPDQAAETIAALMARGMSTIKQTLEGASPEPSRGDSPA
jgi:carbon monoxide dehydrogenase subunit G